MTVPHASTIVITGVTRGLGRAMVDEFDRLGHTVIGCARTKREIEELAKLFPNHDFQVVDVASDPEVRAWARRLSKKYKPPDFVLNNAAVLNVKASLWEVPHRDFSAEVDINIKGVANVIRHFVPWMIPHRRGVVVNFTSRWGKQFQRQMGPYCATKWAVVALTRTLAAELRPLGLGAIALNPGVVRTGMFQRYLNGGLDSADVENPLAPEEWARVAAPFILRLRLKDSGKVRKVLTAR
jgi:NAD(P)-dependent dehydrogenase (short-subunit alcohol dehydrogenase family)